MAQSTQADRQKIQFDEIIKCGRDPEYFLKTYVKIQHPMKGKIPFETYPFQDECLRAFREHRFNIVLKSRQLGLSTISAGYALWQAMFYRDKNILVIATKLKTAINFIKKVKVMYASLPPWMADMLKLKVETTQQDLKFSNGSQIVATPTSEDSGRSEGISTLIVDECVSFQTLVTLRHKLTGEVMSIQIGDLYNLLDEQQTPTSDRTSTMSIMREDLEALPDVVTPCQ